MAAALSPQDLYVELTPSARTDRDAIFRGLFHAHYEYVWTSLRRLGVPDRDRDDVCSELFVRVYDRIDQLDASRSPKPWLFAFAVRLSSDYRRLARHRVEKLDGDAEAPSVASSFAPPDEIAENEERRRLVLEALDSLDLDKRAVVVLHDLDETPIPEVARALGIPEGTAYSRLRAGRAELTTALRRSMQRRSA